jgi:hypothetical protein
MENSMHPTQERTITIDLIVGSPAWHYPPINVVSHDQSLIDQLHKKIHMLKPVTGRYYGQLLWGYALHIEEQSPEGRIIFSGDASLNGLRFLSIGTEPSPTNFYHTDSDFWELLSLIAGQPLLEQGHHIKSS